MSRRLNCSRVLRIFLVNKVAFDPSREKRNLCANAGEWFSNAGKAAQWVINRAAHLIADWRSKARPGAKYI
jgi:hypothetical protein